LRRFGSDRNFEEISSRLIDQGLCEFISAVGIDKSPSG